MADTPHKPAGKASTASAGSEAHPFDNELAAAVKDSAQQIWQAGLGAFAKAQGEGGKVFDALVKEGLSIQRKTQTVAEAKLNEATERMTRLSEGVQTKAGQQWDRLESIFEERVAKALGKIGVPLNSDIGALIERIDVLSAEVAGLSRSLGARKPVRTASAKAASGKRAAPAKRPAARKRST